MEQRTLNIDGNIIYCFEDGKIQYYIQKKGKGCKELVETYGNNANYKNVTIKRKTYKVHRLIAMAFKENPNNYEFVDHIDRNKYNNSASNLRWVDRQINQENSNRIEKAILRDGYRFIDDIKRYHRESKLSMKYPDGKLTMLVVTKEERIVLKPLNLKERYLKLIELRNKS